MQANYKKVTAFWFDELTPDQWFKKDEALDAEIKEHFADLHTQAATCELWFWREHAEGRLAEIILLDQFSRNMFRGTAEAFAYDPLSLALAQEAVSLGVDRQLSATQKAFLYMPFMHSESAAIHEEAVRLFNQPGLETNYDFEIKHKVIIDRYGRYPHRNEVLGRESTPEEVEFLKQPGSGF